MNTHNFAVGDSRKLNSHAMNFTNETISIRFQYHELWIGEIFAQVWNARTMWKVSWAESWRVMHLIKYALSEKYPNKEIFVVRLSRIWTEYADLMRTRKISVYEKCPNMNFFWSLFSRIRTKYKNTVRMRKNTDQEKLCIWTLFTQWWIRWSRY